jgi:hypothetical protein
MTVKRGFWLAVPAVAAFAIDVALTLGGQSGAYWAGDYAAAVEGNPLALPLLVCGPCVFVALAVAWGLGVALLVTRWRHRASDGLALLFTFGHAVGGSTWLARFGPWGWLAATAYLAAAAEVTRWCWRRADWESISGEQAIAPDGAGLSGF